MKKETFKTGSEGDREFYMETAESIHIDSEIGTWRGATGEKNFLYLGWGSKAGNNDSEPY